MNGSSGAREQGAAVLPVVAASPRLRRVAFLPCGGWHTAEDLVQTALAKVFVSWRKIRRQEAVHAYATRTLVNTYLADRRRKRAKEILTDRLPENPAAQLAAGGHQAPSAPPGVGCGLHPRCI